MYTNCCFLSFRTIYVHNMFSCCFDLVVFMYWTGKSMNNLLLYCGLVDAKIRTSDKDLPLLWGQIFNCNNSLICRFNWTTANEIVYFTSHGIEIYNVQPDKRTVKSVRYMNQLISWLVFCPFSSILVLSASKTVSSLILFHLKNGNAYKLPKIDVDEQQIQNKVEVKEKDIQGRFF